MISLDDFRRTRLLFIDTITLRHLHHLHLHYKAGLVEVGRQPEHVLVANGKYIPTGHYTVRVQDGHTIRDIEVFVNKAGGVTEEDSVTIFPLSKEESSPGWVKLSSDEERPPSPKKTSPTS